MSRRKNTKVIDLDQINDEEEEREALRERKRREKHHDKGNKKKGESKGGGGGSDKNGGDISSGGDEDGGGGSIVAKEVSGDAVTPPDDDDGTTITETVVPPPDNQPTALEKFMAILKSLLLRAMVVYFVMSFIRGNNKGVTPTTTTPQTGADGKRIVLSPAENAYSNGTVFDMYCYITENPAIGYSNNELIWKQEGLVYGDWLEGDGGWITHTKEIAVGEKVQKNETSLYIHTIFVPTGNDPRDEGNQMRIYGTRMLTKLKKKREKKERNLLASDSEEPTPKKTDATKPPITILPHHHPNLTITMVTDHTVWTPGNVPAPLNEFINFIPKENKYLPILYFNDYWNLAKDYQPLTSLNKTLQISLTFQPLSLFKWQLYAAQNMRNRFNIMAVFEDAENLENDDEQDTLKETMIETNPVLLILTFAVSLLHSVFEFLAFKNDIQFWNNRKSLEGLSVRSVFFNVFQSLIVLLYVLDNETNFVIKVSCFIGLGIEVWKIFKVIDITPTPSKLFNLIPLPFTLADKSSYTNSPTKEYDALAFRYLSILCFPLLGAYGVYSLIYNEHKSLYSFVLSILYGYLLTFGFIMMTPQLFINYKLKSVAHLPWRMLTYKFLNTFIDDIFAFVIKMPMMYRIGCLRDDVVFFVYLYQRWAYKTDFKRVNEFGWVQGDGENNKGEVLEGGVPQKVIENGGKKNKTEKGENKKEK